MNFSSDFWICELNFSIVENTRMGERPEQNLLHFTIVDHWLVASLSKLDYSFSVACVWCVWYVYVCVYFQHLFDIIISSCQFWAIRILIPIVQAYKFIKCRVVSRFFFVCNFLTLYSLKICIGYGHNVPTWQTCFEMPDTQSEEHRQKKSSSKCSVKCSVLNLRHTL